MRCIVTGGLGFIGSHLVDQLIELGHEVYVIDNLASGNKEYLNPQATWINADIQHDLVGLRAWLQLDVVFHLGAQARIQPSFADPIGTTNANVIGTMHALELAKRYGAKLVYAGSSSFYGDPHKNPYSLSKWFGEEMCKMYQQVYGVPVALARFFNVYGPRQPDEGSNATVIGIFQKQKMNKEPLTVTGSGEQRRDFTHVDDIVSGLLAIAFNNENCWSGEVFNLGTGVNYSINEIVEMFEAKEVVHLAKRPGEAEETLALITFTQETLDWSPQIELEDYVNDFLDEVDPLPDEGWWAWVKRLLSS